MDKLSKVRRYLERNTSVVALTPEALSYALNTFLNRSNRLHLADLLCALIDDSIGGNFALGAGAAWRDAGAELMHAQLDGLLDKELLNDEEKERGRQAVTGPHTPTSLLVLLAKTAAAIQGRRDAKALEQLLKRAA